MELFCDKKYDASPEELAVLIDTPLGKRAWKDVYKALYWYDARRKKEKERSERNRISALKGWETRRAK